MFRRSLMTTACFAPDGEGDGGAPIDTGTPAGGQSIPAGGDQSGDGQDLDLDLGTDAAGDGQAEDEEEELEWDGKKFRLKKDIAEALKPGLLRTADYTKKTQEVAETRKALESEKTQIQQAREAVAKYGAEIGQLYNIDAQLHQYKEAEKTPGGLSAYWAKIETEQGPAEAARQFREYNLLKDARNGVVSALQQKQEAEALETQRTTAKRFEEGKAAVAKEIPGWSNELAEKLNGYGVENGFSLDELTASITEPRYVKMLHKAYLYDQAVAKQKAARKAEIPEAEPVTQVGSRKSPVRFDPVTSAKSLDTDDWIKRRNQQLAAQRGARR